MAVSENEGVAALLEQRGFWTELKGKINKILPHVDTIIRLQTEFDANKDKEVTPYKTLLLELTDVEEELLNGIEYVMRKSHFGDKVFVNSVENSVSDVKVGGWVCAIDDEETDLQSVEEFKEKVNSFGDNEFSIEFKVPMDWWHKKFRKVKKTPEGEPTDFVAFEEWYFRLHTPEKKYNRLTPKKKVKRDEAIKECTIVTENLAEGDLRVEVTKMLERLGAPFTREELGEYNFVVKRITGQVQKKERELLAEIKLAKANN